MRQNQFLRAPSFQDPGFAHESAKNSSRASKYFAKNKLESTQNTEKHDDGNPSHNKESKLKVSFEKHQDAAIVAKVDEIQGTLDANAEFQELQKPVQQRHRSIKDTLILGPIDKYVKYGMFPYKFVIHIILLLLTAWLVLSNIWYEATYSAQLEQNLNYLFLSTDPDAFGQTEIMTSIYLYDVDELRQFGERTIDNYFSLSDPKNPGLEEMVPLKNLTTGEAEPI